MILEQAIVEALETGALATGLLAAPLCAIPLYRRSALSVIIAHHTQIRMITLPVAVSVGTSRWAI